MAIFKQDKSISIIRFLLLLSMLFTKSIFGQDKTPDPDEVPERTSLKKLAEIKGKTNSAPNENASTVYTQKAKDIFTQGQMPEALSEQANPQIPKELEETFIRQRQSADGPIVAIVDNGVDYLHPNLKDHINWRIEADKIIGAGKDVLGADSWAFPNIFNGGLFAFGAEEITEEGKILGAVDNPLALYDQFNKQFINHLRDNIQKHPVLRESLFTKINEDSFSLSGAFRLFSNPEGSFNLANYNQHKEAQALIGPYSLVDKPDSLIVKYLAQDDWQLGSEFGLPRSPFSFDDTQSLNFFEKIEHADEFMAVLKESFDKIQTQPDFQKSFQNYLKFNLLRNKQNISNISTFSADLMADLHQGWFGVKYNFIHKDPRARLYLSLKNLIQLDELKTLEDPATDLADKKAILLEAVERQFNNLQGLYAAKINQGFISSSEKNAYLSSIQNLEGIKLEVQTMINEQGFEHLLNQNPLRSELPMSNFQKYFAEAFHPFLEQNMNFTISHGTHVAGIVVAQEPEALIEPVRVTLMGKLHSPQEAQKIISRQLKEINAWLKEPLYVHSMWSLIADQFDSKKEVDLSTNEGLETARKKIIGLMETVFGMDPINWSAGLDSGNSVFEAIKHVGNSKISLANLSLGSFMQRPAGTDNLGGAVQMILTEYKRYKTVRLMQRHAPHTTFIIAAGNDGAWVDGHSQRTNPGFLHSPLIEEFEQKLNIKTAENKINNVLTVGSVRDDGHFSGFTNISLKDEAFVFSPGEQVDSAIKRTDITGAITQFKEESAMLAPLELSPKNDIDRMLVEGIGQFENLSSQQKAQRIQSMMTNLNHTSQNFANGVNSSRIWDYCGKAGICHAKKSGTSMASPHITGVLAQMTHAKMKKLGLKAEEIYGHPEFTPEKIMTDFLSKTQTKGGSEFGKTVQVYDNVLPYQPKMNNEGCGKAMKNIFKAI